MVLVLETKAETNPTFLSQVTTVRWTLASRSKQSYVATYVAISLIFRSAM